jgi:hypothetical protein
MNMTEQDLKQCYLALRRVTPSDAIVRADAGIRLELIERYGEDRQRELVGEWNAEGDGEIDEDGPGIDGLELRRLAQQGLAFEFVEAGMPLEWATRHSHVFQYMPPVYEAADEGDLRTNREARLAGGDFAYARNYGNHELALAILRGSADAIRELTHAILAILTQWRAEEEANGREFGKNYEVEKHEWLHAHANEMAEWGRRVMQRRR